MTASYPEVCERCGGLLPPYERHGDRSLPFCQIAYHANRKTMIALLVGRWDLLPQEEWPWTTDCLRNAYAALIREEQQKWRTAEF